LSKFDYKFYSVIDLIETIGLNKSKIILNQSTFMKKIPKIQCAIGQS